MSLFNKILVWVFLIVVIGVVGRMDMEDEQANDINYCNMRMLYEADRARGMAREHRSGWPAFKPELESYCASIPVSKD